MTHLALAWAIKNDNVSTCILGASKPEQVVENLKALDVLPKLTAEVMKKIDDILDNVPAKPVSEERRISVPPAQGIVVGWEQDVSADDDGCVLCVRFSLLSVVRSTRSSESGKVHG